ncbi:hypothetical protein Micbo1qcDRAFT_207747 [Microdochium bolleyi]|uniref:Transcription factor domain-containing protein n=1 Tax=Microdochium bolleyi TaxID=196109 RepID=A0A136ISL0_9PEZI|nr:hypothetical protein Micbo1qcDRAFT_207747 [Microdochium bolleyi]
MPLHSKVIELPDFFDHMPAQVEILSAHSLDGFPDPFEADFQAFVSDGGFEFSTDCLLKEPVTFSSPSWLGSEAFGKLQVRHEGAAPIDSSAVANPEALIDFELPDVRCDGLRTLLLQIANQQHDPSEALSAADCTSAQRLPRTISNLEQYARQQQQQQNRQEGGAGNGWLAQSSEVLASTARQLLPVKTERDALLDAYFCAFESVVYILDPGRFLESYESFWSRPASQHRVSDDIIACKILIAVSIGCCVRPDMTALDNRLLRAQTGDGLTQASEWFRRKMTEGYEFEPPDVAQILCLLALARHTQGSLLLGATGSLLGNCDPTRVGMQLGFHRDALIRKPGLSPREVESRRMLWATMVELCIQLSLDQGLPPPIYPESYDCELPTTSPHPASLASSSIIGHLAQTQRLRLQALHIVNSPGSSATREQCHRLAGDLGRLCREGVEAIHTTRHGGGVTLYQVKSLEASILPYIMALHSRSADKIPNSPESYYARCMRMECASALLRHTLSQRSRSNSIGSTHDRHPNWRHHDTRDEMSTSWGRTSPIMSRASLPRTRSDSKASATSSSASASSAPFPSVQDPYISLCLRGHGHVLQVQRQATAALFLDLIDDLEEGHFAVLHRATRQELLSLLRNAVALFERRMRLAGGVHSMREYALFTSASSYVNALVDRQLHTDSSDRSSRSGSSHGTALGNDVDESVAKAAMTALDVCTQVARGPSSHTEITL